jgi:phosphoglycolate phosphatase
VRLIVFDLDGTLVDSRRDLAESANALIRASGGQPLPEEAVGRMVGDGAAALVTRVFETAGCEPPADALKRFLEVYDSRLLRFTRPYPGVADVLHELKGRARLAVLTNKPIGATRQILEGLDLARFFPPTGVVGGDGPFPRKPDPTGLRHLAADAGVEPEATVLVGDSLVDWRTAKAAGTLICLARYGFGFDGFPHHELSAGDVVIDAPSELLARLG